MHDQVTVSELDELCRQASILYDRSDELAAKVKELNKEIADLDAKILAHFDQTDKDSYVVKGIGTFYKNHRHTVTVPKGEDKLRFFDYLKARGVFEEMATVNSNTLNAFVQAEITAQLEAGIVDFKMPGISEPKMIVTLRLRKAN